MVAILLGGQFGSNWGAGARQAREEQDEMNKRGLTTELVNAVKECAQGLNDAEEALASAKDSFRLEVCTYHTNPLETQPNPTSYRPARIRT